MASLETSSANEHRFPLLWLRDPKLHDALMGMLQQMETPEMPVQTTLPLEKIIPVGSKATVLEYLFSSAGHLQRLDWIEHLLPSVSNEKSRKYFYEFLEAKKFKSCKFMFENGDSENFLLDHDEQNLLSMSKEELEFVREMDLLDENLAFALEKLELVRSILTQ
jgi:hypothetical protein